MTMIAPQVQHSFSIRKEKKKTKRKKTRNPAGESSSCYGSDNLFPTVNVPGGLTGLSDVYRTVLKLEINKTDSRLHHIEI